MPVAHNTKGIVRVGVSKEFHSDYRSLTHPGKPEEERKKIDAAAVMRYWRTGKYTPQDGETEPKSKPAVSPQKSPAKKDKSTKAKARARISTELERSLGKATAGSYESPKPINSGKTAEEHDDCERERIMREWRESMPIAQRSKPEPPAPYGGAPQQVDNPEKRKISRKNKIRRRLPKPLQNRQLSKKPKHLPREDKDKRAAQDVLDKLAIKENQDARPAAENLLKDTEARRIRARTRGRKRTTPIFGEAPKNTISNRHGWKILEAAKKFNLATKRKGDREGALGFRGIYLLGTINEIRSKSPDGRVFPSIETLMAMTGMCRGAVTAHTAKLECAGFLEVFNRMERTVKKSVSSITNEVVEVVQVRQTSNAYTMHMPEALDDKIEADKMEDPNVSRPFPSPRPFPPGYEFLAGSNPVVKACAEVFKKIGALSETLECPETLASLPGS